MKAKKGDLMTGFGKTIMGLFGLVSSFVFLLNEASATSLRPDDRMAVAIGGQIYAKHCAQCHGADLEGQANWRERQANGRLRAPPHDASGHTWHHPDSVLFKLTKRGPAAVAGGRHESDMPGYAGVLTDDQIVAVLSYIKSRWPEEIRRANDRINGGNQ